MKLLIADDSATNLEMMRMIFEGSDFELFTAKNGTEAYQVLQHEQIQLALIDWMMPDITGIDLIKQIRQFVFDRFLYLIMVTAKDGTDALIEGFESGADDFIHRPFSTRELRARVNVARRIVENHNAIEEAKRTIEQAKQEWEATADAINQLVCLVNENGQIMRANQTIEQWKLAPLSNIRHQYLYTVIANGYDDFAAQLEGIWGFVQQRIYNGLGFEFMGDDLSTGHHFHVQIEPIAHDTSRVVSKDSFAAVSIQNVTERRNLELALQDANQKLEKQHQQSERLLLNILPKPISERLKRGESVIADEFESASVIFTDLVGFTEFASTLPPSQLVSLLSEVFAQFDRLTEKHGLEKIKTIGDAYMAVSGVPVPSPNHAENAVCLGLDMIDGVQKFNKRHNLNLQIRVGIHSGAVVAGVIGTRKFAYDLWGDTVNIASRMESTGVANTVHVSDTTADLLPSGSYALQQRDPIQVKGRGEMQTYLITRSPQSTTPDNQT